MPTVFPGANDLLLVLDDQTVKEFRYYEIQTIYINNI